MINLQTFPKRERAFVLVLLYYYYLQGKERSEVFAITLVFQYKTTLNQVNCESLYDSSSKSKWTVNLTFSCNKILSPPRS